MIDKVYMIFIQEKLILHPYTLETYMVNILERLIGTFEGLNEGKLNLLCVFNDMRCKSALGLQKKRSFLYIFESFFEFLYCL